MYSTREISLDVMRKPAGNKGRHTEGQHTETSGSAWERNWVVGLQILTNCPDIGIVTSVLSLQSLSEVGEDKLCWVCIKGLEVVDRTEEVCSDAV